MKTNQKSRCLRHRTCLQHIAIFSFVPLIFSACGSSRHSSKTDDYELGYVRIGYFDAWGNAQSIGTPLVKTGNGYEQTADLQFSERIASQVSIEVDLPQCETVGSGTNFRRTLDSGGSVVSLPLQNETIGRRGDQTVLTAEVVDLDDFVPNGTTSGTLGLQFNNKIPSQSEWISVRFHANTE